MQHVVQGKHGRYAVATTKQIEGSVTFSLNVEVWQEASLPEPGSFVMLADLQRKTAGWRAMQARFMRPEDELSSSVQPDTEALRKGQQ